MAPVRPRDYGRPHHIECYHPTPERPCRAVWGVKAQQNHQPSLNTKCRDHQRSHTMTQPAALGMTQPCTRNPVSPRPHSSPHLRPHLQRYQPRSRPRPHVHTEPELSRYHMTPTTERCPHHVMMAQPPHHAWTAASCTCTEQRQMMAQRPHRATPMISYPCDPATAQHPAKPHPRATLRTVTRHPRVM